MAKFEEYIQDKSEIVSFTNNYELGPDTAFKRKKKEFLKKKIMHK